MVTPLVQEWRPREQRIDSSNHHCLLLAATQTLATDPTLTFAKNGGACFSAVDFQQCQPPL